MITIVGKLRHYILNDSSKYEGPLVAPCLDWLRSMNRFFSIEFFYKRLAHYQREVLKIKSKIKFLQLRKFKS